MKKACSNGIVGIGSWIFNIALFMLLVLCPQVHAQTEQEASQLQVIVKDGIGCEGDQVICSGGKGIVSCGSEATFYSESGKTYLWRLVTAGGLEGGASINGYAIGPSVTIDAPIANPGCEWNATLEMVENAGTPGEEIFGSKDLTFNCVTGTQSAYVTVLSWDNLCDMPEAYCRAYDYKTGTLYDYQTGNRPAYNFNCAGQQGAINYQYSCNGGSGVHFPDCSTYESFCIERTAYCNDYQSVLPLDLRTDAMIQAGCCPDIFFELDLEANN